MILYQVAKRLELREEAKLSGSPESEADAWLRDLIAAGNRGIPVTDIRTGEAETGREPVAELSGPV